MVENITDEQIKSWQDKYGKGNIICLEFGKAKIYLLDPAKSTNYFHMAKRMMIEQQKNDLIGSGEIIFNECYLGGLGERKEIDKNTAEYINTCVHCTNLIPVLEVNFTTL